MTKTIGGRVPVIEEFSFKNESWCIIKCGHERLDKRLDKSGRWQHWSYVGCLVWSTREDAQAFIDKHADQPVPPAVPAVPAASGRELPDSDGRWKRDDGNWDIITGELSHNCRDAYAGWRMGEIVNGLVSDLPRGNWHKATAPQAATRIRNGDTVKWLSSKKPVGVVVHIFMFKGFEFSVVEKANNKLEVLRIYENLEVVQKSNL